MKRPQFTLRALLVAMLVVAWVASGIVLAIFSPDTLALFADLMAGPAALVMVIKVWLPLWRRSRK